MSTPTPLGSRLIYLMAAHHLSESELARRSGVPQPTIHRILKGTSQSPRMKNVEQLARALGVDVAFLAYGERKSTDSTAPQEPLEALKSALTHTLQQAQYQRPEWVLERMEQGTASTAASSVTGTACSFPFLQWRQASHPETIDCELSWEPTVYSAQGACFWLEIKGDAMTAPPGNSPSLSNGTRVLFDTGKPLAKDCIVLILLPNSQDSVCRQLVVEGNDIYLKPLNPSYQVTPLEPGSALLAVAVEAKQTL
ncbi:helix-turn-helix domain-containing protein [Billgrantia sulfidoxydans]|uniref:Helix-turn-helix domain-containing protein n=1 Tax=Billgrantia sulfidoxydans TaxID=2733484 RepID=A0ABX7W7I3_9GAMM|nr:XRE family transcriptional regulator [Halomonas sulfidoxydans]QTP56334.1 helix-turn-helix domain-containing protein [Halomonas sulfidoxydans]